jgi:hypothetical protein
MMVSKEWRDSLWITVVCVAHFAISFFVTVILLGFAGIPKNNQHTHNWASFLSGLSMISACLQYLPQVWKTWRLKVYHCNKKRKMKEKNRGENKKGLLIS